MACRVEEDAEAGLALGWNPARTEFQHLSFGRVDVVHADVQMQLLWMLGIRPAGRHVRRRALERELPHTRLQTDDDPIPNVLIDSHAQQFRVERRQRSRIRAVEDGLLQSADHVSSLPTPRLLLQRRKKIDLTTARVAWENQESEVVITNPDSGVTVHLPIRRGPASLPTREIEALADALATNLDPMVSEQLRRAARVDH